LQVQPYSKLSHFRVYQSSPPKNAGEHLITNLSRYTWGQPQKL
jgi:hypothetical protein